METEPESVSALIEELRQLRITGAEIRRRELEISERLEEILLAQERKPERTHKPPSVITDETPPFKTGIRVKILNKVSRPYSWIGAWDATAIAKYRLGTVTQVKGEKIYIKTDLRGINTWRLSKHLSVLP